MFNATQLLKTGLNALSDNAPAILTAFGAVGVVTTGVLSAKASFEAAAVLAEDDRNREIFEENNPVEIQPRTQLETFRLVAPLYVPAAFTGTLSVAAIVMSHRISSKRAAVLAAAYALNEGKLEEYQEKVKEKIGLKKEKEVRDEINSDKVVRSGDAGFEYANPISGKVWIMEAYTGRPFLSTVENVKQAVNEINHEINNSGAVRMSDFYDTLKQIDPTAKLDHVSTSDYFGWTRAERLEIDWSTTTSPDGSLAVHVFEYVNHPVMNPEADASFR